MPLVLGGGLLPPRMILPFTLGTLQISSLGVATSPALEEKREGWSRKGKRSPAPCHSMQFPLRRWSRNPSQPPPSSTPRHTSIRVGCEAEFK